MELGTSLGVSKATGWVKVSVTYFLIGQTHSPQHWAMSVRFFSASLMSLLMESMPSSMRSSCSVRNRSLRGFGFHADVYKTSP